MIRKLLMLDFLILKLLVFAVCAAIALIYPLFIEDGEILDCENRKVATFSEIASPQQLQELHSVDELAENVVISLLDWQVIPAENIVATFQGSKKMVFAISKGPSEAQIFLEALEQGLGGIVFKVEDPSAVLELKDYFDRRNEVRNLLRLTRATVTQVQIAGMGDRVCVDLCTLMRPSEGLLVGSFARGLFCVHLECLESNYIAIRPFRVSAGPVHAYVAVPEGKTSYISELQTGKEVLVVDPKWSAMDSSCGVCVKIETRPLILVEAKYSLLWETLMGREHLLFYGRLKNHKGSALTQAVKESLRNVNLFHGGVADKKAGKYSGGMKRRLVLPFH